jgi:hypothetical protein
MVKLGRYDESDGTDGGVEELGVQKIARKKRWDDSPAVPKSNRKGRTKRKGGKIPAGEGVGEWL